MDPRNGTQSSPITGREWDSGGVPGGADLRRPADRPGKPAEQSRPVTQPKPPSRLAVRVRQTPEQNEHRCSSYPSLLLLLYFRAVAVRQSPQNPSPTVPPQIPRVVKIKSLLEGLGQEDSDTCRRLGPVPCRSSPRVPG